MRFIYLKIFVWFWIAMVAVGITLGFVVSKTGNDPMSGPWRQEMSALLPALAEKMAEVFEKQGPKSLRQYESTGAGPLSIQIHFLDEHGQELSGPEDLAETESSEEMKELAIRANRSGKMEFADTGRIRRVAYRVSGPSGRQYVYELALSPSKPMPPFLNARPSAQLIRIFAVVGVGGVVCLWLAWYISSPMRELQAATRALASGDLHARVAQEVCRRSDEFGDLGIDFNAMAERMQSLLESQRRLLRDISHELRSPLARLRVALDLAKEGAEPYSLRAHQRIEIEAERINEMIGDLLRLSRMETLTALPDKSEIDLAELVDEVVAETELETSQTGRSMQVLAEPCTILGNESLLRSVLENLIRNAMRYTPEGTAVEIDLKKQRQGGAWHALLSVRDRGPGVPDTHLEDIFEAFYRVEYSRDRESGGTGLGLSIAQRAVHLHNGSIRAVNLARGGLEIEVLLPLTDIQTHPPGDLGISHEVSAG